MRRLVTTDDVPVLVRTGNDFAIESRKATTANVVVDSEDVVMAVLMDGAAPRPIGCQWSWIQIDDQHICYDAIGSRRPVVAFAANYDDALAYVSILRDRAPTRVAEDRRSQTDDLLNRTGVVQSQAKEALSKGTGSTKDVKVASSSLAAQWANCGFSSANLLIQLTELCGVDRRLRQTGMVTVKEFKAASQLVFTEPGPLFVDVSFHNIHTFSLEVHSDGGYLVQGFQSAYSAFWWQAITEEPLMLPGMAADANKQLLPDDWDTHRPGALKHRAGWGGGTKLSLAQIQELLDGVAGIIAAGVDKNWSPASHDLFVALPFYVGQSRDVTVGSGHDTLTPKPPSMLRADINIHRLKDPQAAYAVLEAKGGSLSDLVLRRVFQRMVTLAQSLG
jgi:hypothetical protein